MKLKTTHIEEGRQIGGWLWLIGIWLILGLLVNSVSKIFTIQEVLPSYDKFISADCKSSAQSGPKGVKAYVGLG